MQIMLGGLLFYFLTSKVKDKFSVISMEELSLAKLYVTTIV